LPSEKDEARGGSYRTMGVSRYWCHAEKFVLTTVSGALDNQGLLEHVQALNQECHGITGVNELADCRALNDVDHVSVPGITRACLQEENKPGSRLAILVPRQSPVMYGMARVYQMFAADSREAAKVFTNLDEALCWLVPDAKQRGPLMELVNSHASLPKSTDSSSGSLNPYRRG